MNKFRKSKSKLAVALLSTLFCNGNGTSAMNTGNLSNRKSSLSVNSNSDSKSAQNLGAVGGATSGNIRISNSNNNKFFDYVKNHKWQFGVGVLSVATVITLAIVGGKYLSKKNDVPGKGPGPDKDKKENDDKKKDKEKDKEQKKENDPNKKEEMPNEFPYKQENLNLISSAGKLEGLSFNYFDVFSGIMTYIQSGGLDSNNACKDIVDVMKGRKKLEKFEFERAEKNGIYLKFSCFANLTVGGKIYTINFSNGSQFVVFDYTGGQDGKQISGLISVIQN